MYIHPASIPCSLPFSLHDALPILILEPLAQRALLELAGRRARNRVDELERVGQPELREARREKRLQLGRRRGVALDRKSTRLNSSHRCISYAVSCLQNKQYTQTST